MVVFPEEVHRACYKIDNVEKSKNSRENRHEFIIGGAGYDKNCPGDGGSKGIGYAAAKALYDIGYTVIVAARNEETLQQCAQGLAKERFIPLVADVTDESAVVALFAEIKALFGRLDLLVQ